MVWAGRSRGKENEDVLLTHARPSQSAGEERNHKFLNRGRLGSRGTLAEETQRLGHLCHNMEGTMRSGVSRL